MATGHAFIKFSHPSLTDYLIITWAEFDSPLAEVGRASYPAPHPETSLTVDNVRPVMHRFTWWTSSDGVTLGTALLTMDIDCGIVNSELAVYDYQVDRGSSGTSPAWADPVSNTSALPNDARWAGAKYISVERRGFGTLLPSEYTADLANGSFSIIGNTFEKDDVWFVKTSSIVEANSAPSAPSSTADPYMESVTFSSDGDYNPATMGRREVIVTTTSNVATMSFAALSGLSKTKVLITTHGMTGKYLKLALSSGDTFTHPVFGNSVSALYVRRAMEVEIVVGAGDFRILRYDGDGKRVGDVCYGRGIEVNRVPFDGSEYGFDDLPGLYYEYVSQLPSAQIKDYDSWALSSSVDGRDVYQNKGYFAIDSVNRKFKVPDLRETFLRGVSSFDTPGRWQSDNIRRQSGVSGVKITGSGSIAQPTDSITGGKQFSLEECFTLPGNGSDTNPNNHALILQVII